MSMIARHVHGERHWDRRDGRLTFAALRSALLIGSMATRGLPPEGGYQRRSIEAQVNPEPKPMSNRRSPRSSFPERWVWSRRRGMDAALVFPYF